MFIKIKNIDDETILVNDNMIMSAYYDSRTNKVIIELTNGKTIYSAYDDIDKLLKILDKRKYLTE